MSDQARPLNEELDRLLRVFAPDTRVVAAVTIIYGSGDEIAEGTKGIIIASGVNGCDPLHLVRWDTGLEIATIVSALDLDFS